MIVRVNGKSEDRMNMHFSEQEKILNMKNKLRISDFDTNNGN